MPFRIRVFLSILLAFLVLLLVGPLLLPLPELEGTAEPRALALDESEFTTVGGVDLHYLEEGNGSPAFLLLHGYPGNALSWRAMQSELALYGRTVAFDRPGFGLSERPLPGEWPRGDNPYLPRAQVQQAVDLLDRLGIEEAVWIGSSSGALTAMQAAIEYPERVVALVVLGAPIYSERVPPAWLRPLLYSPQMNRVGPLLMRQLGTSPGRNLFASQWSDPEQIDEAELEAFQLTFETEDWDRGLWEVSKASRDTKLEQRLERLELPMLVVAGAQDPIVAPEESEQLARELPNATLALMEGCGHLPHQECPLQLIEVVSSWLAEVAWTRSEE